jgi:hypothetical protein
MAILGGALMLAVTMTAHAADTTTVRNWPTVAAYLHGEIRPIERLSPDRQAAAALRLGFLMRTSTLVPPRPGVTFDLDSSRIALAPQGMPRCGIEELREAPERLVGETCRSARLGTGSLLYSGGFVGAAFNLRVDLALFNGAIRGHPVIFARLHEGFGFPGGRIFSDNVLVLNLRRRAGLLDTSLVAKFPTLKFPHDSTVYGMDLSLNRRYRAHGEVHSYATATCRGRRSATRRPYARITRALQDGSKVSGLLRGRCRAKVGSKLQRPGSDPGPRRR